MTGTVLMTECSGLWRRTLLIKSDGSRDTGTDVAWLQGITAYADTRGFAGRLSQHDDVFEWQRLIDRADSDKLRKAKERLEQASGSKES